MIGGLTRPVASTRATESRAVTALKWTAFYAALCLGALVMVVPLLWMVAIASKPLAETMSLEFSLVPSGYLLENFAAAFRRVPVARYFANSVVVSVTVTVGELLIASLAGFSLARYSYPGRDLVFILILSTMMIPFFVVVIPLYIVVYTLGWLNSYLALIVPGLASAFGIFLMRQFMLTIPSELVDAARIDGASEPTIFARIIAPLCTPAFATLGILSFMAHWDAFVWPLMVINRKDMYTLPLGLAFFQSEYLTFWNELMAAALLGMLPTFVLFLFFQRFFVQGVVMSGLKG
jgi:ABC-type glycerol-3-phosphate transport system permease component